MKKVFNLLTHVGSRLVPVSGAQLVLKSAEPPAMLGVLPGGKPDPFAIGITPPGPKRGGYVIRLSIPGSAGQGMHGVVIKLRRDGGGMKFQASTWRPNGQGKLVAFRRALRQK